MKRLVIISHTEHYQLADGTIVGFGPTVTEINHLLDLFDSIAHVAMLHKGTAPAHALPYSSERITFVPIPALGGQGLKAKFSLLSHAFSILKIIRVSLQQADYFQFRGPTGIGVFVVPYLIFFTRKKGWFKYAGNWKQEQAPLAYTWQRWLFKIQKRPVTINGYWDKQPPHCLSFENPCLTDIELQEGQVTIRDKVFKPSAIHLCFVGRLEAEKGIGLLIDALMVLPINQQQQLHTVHILGGGADAQLYQQQAAASGIHFKFYGVLSREAVHGIYKKCHGIVLPSASEGFPKVIAEAMNYGCVPIVSDVSSIGHYIENGLNGFLIYSLDVAGVSSTLNKFLSLSQYEYFNLMPKNEMEIAKFSYNYYNNRLKEMIL
uniref:glycosyltransferase n=1 Tax=Gelidibacter sp. TaxID=2018083 RepID=UPI004049F76A